MCKIFDLKPKDIKDLKLKLDGKLPVNRDELLALVNSWGRNSSFYTLDKNGDEIEIKECRKNKKYELSKLDVSQIKDFKDIFYYSNFNSNINSWDVSKATSLAYMFAYTTNFNSHLNSWDVSNVIYIYGMFFKSENFNQPLDNWNISKIKSLNLLFSYAEKFNQDLNSWDISQVTSMNYTFEGTKAFNQPILWNLSKEVYCIDMFYNTKTFAEKFNKENELPRNTNGIKEWLIKNRDRMIALDVKISKGKELDNFLLDISLENKSFIEKLFIKFKYL